MDAEIRNYQPADLDALYRICVRTGADGDDATAQYSDPLLLGHYYAAPYACHDPELCLLATVGGEPSGYVLGTADSLQFRAWLEAEWLPPLRRRYPLPGPDDAGADAELIRKLHAGYEPAADPQVYPAHLHIDLLPVIQGRGLGRKLLELFFDRLRRRGCPAVHLGVSETNRRALAFYEKMGFELLARHAGWRAYGRTL